MSAMPRMCILCFLISSFVVVCSLFVYANGHAKDVQITPARELQYSILLGNEKVGTQSSFWTMPTKGSDRLKLTQEVKVTIKSFWGDLLIKENGEYRWFKGSFEGADLTANDAESSVKSSMTASKDKVRFLVAENGGKPRREEFDRKGMDGIVLGFPMLLAARKYEVRGKEFRLLDTSEHEVFDYKVVNAEDADLEAAGNKFRCRKVTIKSGKDTLVQWIAVDRLGAFIVREEADTGFGVFVTELDSYVLKGL